MSARKLVALFRGRPKKNRRSGFQPRSARATLIPAAKLPALLAVAILCTCGKGDAQVKIEALGIPIKAVVFGNSHGVLARSPAGDDGMFYIPYYSTTGSALIGIHPGTGEHVTIKLGSSGGYGCAVGTDDAIYVGGINPGNLYRYDPATNKMDNLGGAKFGVKYLWDLAAAPDGKVYGAAYPTCSILEYDINTGELRDLGKLVEGKQYTRSICVDPEGKVWGGVGTGGAHLMVVDPATGAKRDVLPEEYRKCSSAYDLHVSGDYVFCATSMPGYLLVFDAKTHELVRALPPPEGDVWWMCGNSGADGVIWPHSSPSGSFYRYDAKADKLELLLEAMGQPEIVVDERFVHVVNDQDYVYYDLAEKKELMRKKLTEAGQGMSIYSLAAGTDGNIYGSTYINQHIFRCTAETGELTDLGKVIRWGGQVDSMYGAKDGKIYMGAYVYANMAIYDPSKPWEPGPGKDANPRELGPAGKGQYRTRCIVLGPDANIYMGSIPSYGSAPTGGFARWDSKTEETTCWTDFVPGGTVEDLRADDKWVYGHGGEEFFVLDCAKMEKVFVAKLKPSALEVAGTGHVLASVGDEIAVFDPTEMKFLDPLKSPVGGLGEMTRMTDGKVCGINNKAIIEIDPTTWKVEQIAEEGGSFLASDKQGRLYFARGSRLFRMSPRGSVSP